MPLHVGRAGLHMGRTTRVVVLWRHHSEEQWPLEFRADQPLEFEHSVEPMPFLHTTECDAES